MDFQILTLAEVLLDITLMCLPCHGALVLHKSHLSAIILRNIIPERTPVNRY